MENRTAFWRQIPSGRNAQLQRANGAIAVHADRRHLRLNWWKAACPLSGIDCRIRPFVHEAGQGPNWPIYWWKAACPLWGTPMA